MKRHLPPLNALKVFEVAAKTGSFSRAADVLYVTQSAVSKQIRVLEEHLGTSLFHRHGAILRLTIDGERYLTDVSKGLDILEAGSERFYNKDDREVLTINVMPSLSALWMFSRVNTFQKLHPNIVLHIDSENNAIEATSKKIDVAIRCFSSDKHYSHAELLFRESLHLIISPELMNKNPIHQLSDINKHQCIGLNTRPQLWDDFLRDADCRPINNSVCFGCEHFYMVIQAAVEGLGVAIAPDFLCRDFIDKGLLVKPVAHHYLSDYAYYFISPPHKKLDSKVIQFHHWITSELSPSI